MTKIETEYKLEITAKEFAASANYLQEAKFIKKGTSHLEDYFFNIQKFDEKGWNFLRIRVYDGSRYEHTEKIWKHSASGERIREEIERVSSKEELESLIGVSQPLRLSKDRTDYAGVTLDYPAVYSLDVVVFPDETRYFVECEIQVPEGMSSSIRPHLKESMLQTLHLSDRPEGIGMMRLVLSKSREGADD
ncbi:MAG: CYTH domain-containing protein [Candidatus Kaiserbacteria bacterium]|nr:CYTH domain-containing protein [Candidatus Kaiserbacteria bacterium]